MIRFNGHEYSGNVVYENEDELVVSIYTLDTIQDICINLNNVKTVYSITETGVEVAHNVNIASSVVNTGRSIFTIKFGKKLTFLEEMSSAIDSLLVMALEG